MLAQSSGLVFQICPFQLKIDTSEETRNAKNIDDESVKQLALNMIMNKQTNPIALQLDSDGFTLLDGYKRTLAARLIVTGFEYGNILYKKGSFVVNASIKSGCDTKTMRTAIVRFKRFNEDDEDCALDNHPDLFASGARDAALIEQFKAELEESGFMPGKWRVVSTHYSEDNLLLWVEFLIPAILSSEAFVNQIQRICYDLGGMTGHFEVIDIQPRRPEDKVGN